MYKTNQMIVKYYRKVTFRVINVYSTLFYQIIWTDVCENAQRKDNKPRVYIIQHYPHSQDKETITHHQQWLSFAEKELQDSCLVSDYKESTLNMLLCLRGGDVKNPSPIIEHEEDQLHVICDYENCAVP